VIGMSRAERLSPVHLALDHIIKINELWRAIVASEEMKEKNLEGFVRRARQYPSLLAASGLVPSVTFFLSKIIDKDNPDEALRLLVEYLTAEDEDKAKEIMNKMRSEAEALNALKEDAGKKESEGYLWFTGALLAALFAFSEAVGIKVQLSDEERFVHEVATFLRGLQEGRKEALVLERLLLEYSSELKNLAAAYAGAVWGAKGEG